MELNTLQLEKAKEMYSGFTGTTFESFQHYCSWISNWSFGIIPMRIDGKIRYLIKILTEEKEFYAKIKIDGNVYFMVFVNPKVAMNQCLDTVLKTGVIENRYAFLNYKEDLSHLK